MSLEPTCFAELSFDRIIAKLIYEDLVADPYCHGCGYSQRDDVKCMTKKGVRIEAFHNLLFLPRTVFSHFAEGSLI